LNPILKQKYGLNECSCKRHGTNYGKENNLKRSAWKCSNGNTIKEIAPKRERAKVGSSVETCNGV
jgi:hypothetical protein